MIFNQTTKDYIFKGNFGLEKESLRITQDGYISKTLHPFNQDNISRDFCENQVEIVTNVYPSIEKLYDGLKSTNDYVKNTLKNLKEPEYLWYFSNPPYFNGENDIPIASFEDKLNHKQVYREYLAKKYGKRLMLYSGIHYNFSFDNDFLKYAYDKCNDKISYNDFVSNIYLNLAKKLSKYSWLIVALTSASPIYDCSFIDDNFLGVDGFNGYASMRNSSHGYWNKFNLILDYSSLDDYIKSIQHYIDIGKIASIGECYIPVRLKPKGENSLNALKDGVNHIELRMFDLNPLDNVGIKIEDLYFTHYLILYLMSLPNEDFNTQNQIYAIENHKKASNFYLENVKIYMDNKETSLIKKADEILLNMISFFLQLNTTIPIDIIKFERDKILNPKNRYSNQIYEMYKNNFVQKGVELCKNYSKERIEV